MKKVIFVAAMLSFSIIAVGQNQNPSEASQKVVEDSWAKAAKEKAANDEAVAKQRKAEEERRNEEKSRAIDDLIKEVDAEKPKSSGKVVPQ
ncbi:hypothetical protein [Acidiluteibacter ferrifornacis]|uniref:Uncharacterized protein n=1 Tax=Acidiluteibacter ferrifornacis TaxID=2692424 RepID=A0A6N9NFX1_9FLAO|nr:hypothetical protein [Acidiluteibacter ferrifornacis]NBG64692.1 hypothetical protein [Acidiluteibacter ferrifornacis]|tara:strand:+ start:76 stop:348 length:273 start_codon:yes stop_codon:yes gene_type:complete